MNFFERVEHLCKRLADGMDHSDDRTAIMKLGEEAAGKAEEKQEPIAEALIGIADEIKV